MDNNAIEKMIRDVVSQMATTDKSSSPATGEVDYNSYPLSEKMGHKIKSPTGKSLDEITLDAVMKGDVTSEDCKIAPETLEMQAQVAESVGRDAFARNLRRAAEMINIPDARVLEIYNALRPNVSTKQELLAIADELKNKYNAPINSAFVAEAADVYDRRSVLK